MTKLQEAHYVVKHDGVDSDHPDEDAVKLFAGKTGVINHVTKYSDSATKTKSLLQKKGFKNVRIEMGGKVIDESFDPSDLLDEPISSFNHRVDGKYKVQKHAVGRKVQGKSYGAQYDAGEDDTKETHTTATETRGRGRPRKTASAPMAPQFPSSLIPKVLKPKDGFKAIKATRKVRFENISIDTQNELNEVLSKNATAGDWIHDFVHSDNPKFKNKSKEDRIKMALGAYYGQQNESMGLGEQSMAAMGRHAEREWQDEMSSKSAGNIANRHHLVRNGKKISSHPSEKEAISAWSDRADQRGIKIVHEDYDNNQYEYSIKTYQDKILYKYEVTLDGDVIREGYATTLAAAETMGMRKVLMMMEEFEKLFDEPKETKNILNIAKSIATSKE